MGGSEEMQSVYSTPPADWAFVKSKLKEDEEAERKLQKKR